MAFSTTEYLTTTITSLTACITLMISLSYLVALSRVYKYAQAHPKALNKVSGVWIQRYAPYAYVVLVLTSLCEVAIASWLLLQYRFHHNYPNVPALTAIRFLMFSSCWTTITAGAYSMLFVHPTWSKYPIVSVGSQSIWILVTWIFWIVGAGLTNGAVPRLLMDLTTCGDAAYCGHIRAVFAVAVVESLILTGGMATVMWLAWHSARDAWSLNSRPFSVMSRASMLFAPR
ncbi:hypothetical protein FA15DRAFT_586270 [Coprinopsis marcescibilis]|uniref:MARVEL domain-containing protein n=1 Tax=Coprinopsis marcescibilis TaxID=230819 RepID=A0A5C3L389_COPMA|nr:hypothetical protein FA15DRAFT_586270 [Coprinopsis marcescibilis]